MANASQRVFVSGDVRILTGTAAPVDGAVGTGTGAGKMGPGSIYIRTGAPNAMFTNRGTKASPVWERAGRIIAKTQLGRNGAGALTLTGAKVGDPVVNVSRLSATIADGASLFESTITVADQIQQSSATDLSAVFFNFILQR